MCILLYYWANKMMMMKVKYLILHYTDYVDRYYLEYDLFKVDVGLRNGPQIDTALYTVKIHRHQKTTVFPHYLAQLETRTHARTHTHTHTFNGPFPGLPR